MQVSPGFICNHRTRCKYCKGFPKYFTTIFGLSYHGDWGPRGTHRSKFDYTKLRQRDEQDWDYGKLMRENSIRGPASFITYITKNKKDDYGSYRFVISCECGRSTWMYPGPNDNQLFQGRKKLVSLEPYKYRRHLEGVNSGAW